uniref:Uncharacterized protein n=1 Tax=Anguilla anguilla TaxID=7936 RepID=A0A0E9X2P4_ANGAN
MKPDYQGLSFKSNFRSTCTAHTELMINYFCEHSRGGPCPLQIPSCALPTADNNPEYINSTY